VSKSEDGLAPFLDESHGTLKGLGSFFRVSVPVDCVSVSQLLRQDELLLNCLLVLSVKTVLDDVWSMLSELSEKKSEWFGPLELALVFWSTEELVLLSTDAFVFLFTASVSCSNATSR
jgi:hypothetical protein